MAAERKTQHPRGCRSRPTERPTDRDDNQCHDRHVLPGTQPPHDAHDAEHDGKGEHRCGREGVRERAGGRAECALGEPASRARERNGTVGTMFRAFFLAESRSL
jgi:hypothetical protein